MAEGWRERTVQRKELWHQRHERQSSSDMGESWKQFLNDHLEI